MDVISVIMIVFVTVGVGYTLWRMVYGAIKGIELPWFLAIGIVVLSLGLLSGLTFILFTLLTSGTINAGSLLGMVFGMSLILAGFRTFTHQVK